MSEAVIESETSLPTFAEVVAAAQAEEAVEEAAAAEETAAEEVVEEEAAEAAGEPGVEEAGEPAEPGTEPEPEAKAKPEAPAPDDVVVRLERVAAAERELSQRRRENDQLREQMARERQQVEEMYQRLRSAESWLEALEKGDPLPALEARGIKFDQLAQAVATGKGVNPNRELEDRLAKQERELEAWKKAQEDQKRAVARQQAEMSARQEIAAELERTSPVLSAMGEEGVELIWNLANMEGRATGSVPGYDVLVGKGEERLYGLLDKLMAVEAVRARYTGSREQTSPARAASKTVSHQAAATPAKRKIEDVDILDLSDEEAYRRLFGKG